MEKNEHIREFAQKYKPEIEKFLNQFFEKKQKELTLVNRWGPDAAERFAHFVSGGKMLRGLQVLIGFSIEGITPSSESIKAAAAIEIFHAAFLIHDDIIDHDPLRRGKKTIHLQYKEIAQKENIHESQVFGEGMGICGGDLGFFWGYEILSTLSIPADILMPVIGMVSRELAHVGMGEMHDIALSGIPHLPTEQDILACYRYKTARYTFSLPLVLGARLAGAKKVIIDALETVGETMGLMFQIKDDELGMFGDEKVIGKPLGSDIREAKKTLYYLYLMTSADETTRQKLQRVFGNKTITSQDIAFIHQTIHSLEISNRIESIQKKYFKETTQLIQKTDIPIEKKELLLSLASLNQTRTK